MACQHCTSSDLQPFSPVTHVESHGAILLCRACRKITIALPSRRRAPASQSSTALPNAA
jgi:hypothetical protein